MKNHSSSDQDYELWILLNQVRDVLLKAREKELRPHGVTTTQAAALFIIETTGNEATAIEISRWLLREHHSVSGLLSRMEKEGLISRSKDSPSQSLARVTLTEKGRQAYYQSTQRASIRNTMRVLSQEERQLLSSLLKKMRDEGLKQLLGDLKPPFP